jgi:hypothetical protein
MKLRDYLIKYGRCTGPLEKNSSYSHSGTIRNNLLCLPQFKGDEKFLLEGIVLHEAFLQEKWDRFKELNEEQQARVMGMYKALKKHPIVKRLMDKAIKEDKQYETIYGQLISYILDAEQRHFKTGSDIKTTTAKTYDECLTRCIAFGYPGQSHVYKMVRGLKKFYFIFVCKIKPHPIFIIDSDALASYEKKKAEEIEFLMYFYKTYGNIC